MEYFAILTLNAAEAIDASGVTSATATAVVPTPPGGTRKDVFDYMRQLLINDNRRFEQSCVTFFSAEPNTGLR